MKRKQKKIPKRLLENKETWKTNSRNILQIISNGKYPFTEIISKSSLSKTTVLKHIRKMEQNNLIKNEWEDGRSYYVLTVKGKENLLDIVKNHQEFLGGLKNTGSTYFHNRSELGITMAICSLPWGIDPHLTVNVKLEPLHILKNDDIEDIEKILYERISKNLTNIREHDVKFRSDAVDLLDKEKIVLSFNVDLKKFDKSIKKKSLETLENMPEEEISARFQAELKSMENIDDSVFD